VVDKAIAALLWLAHLVAAQPGSVAMLPSVPVAAYGLMITGGLWVMLWRTRPRLLGLVPLTAGVVMALTAPTPDLIITDDGRHLAVRDDAGRLAILRPKSGDFVRQILAERSAYAGELDDLDVARHADCTPDACVIPLQRGGRTWTVLATRSRHMIDWRDLMVLCRKADIIVSERLLPRACIGRWLTIDPRMLRQTGGMAIALNPPKIETVRSAADDHPWMAVRADLPQYRRSNPAKRP
jgi:competence protein ComEC